MFEHSRQRGERKTERERKKEDRQTDRERESVCLNIQNKGGREREKEKKTEIDR